MLEVVNGITTSCEEIEAKILSLIADLKEGRDEEHASYLEESQKAWKIFQEKQCAFRADFARGGSIATYIWASERENLLTERLAQLRWFIEREEGDF